MLPKENWVAKERFSNMAFLFDFCLSGFLHNKMADLDVRGFGWSNSTFLQLENALCSSEKYILKRNKHREKNRTFQAHLTQANSLLSSDVDVTIPELCDHGS